MSAVGLRDAVCPDWTQFVLLFGRIHVGKDLGHGVVFDDGQGEQVLDDSIGPPFAHAVEYCVRGEHGP